MRTLTQSDALRVQYFSDHDGVAMEAQLFFLTNWLLLLLLLFFLKGDQIKIPILLNGGQNKL